MERERAIQVDAKMSAADERRAQLFLKNKERVATHNKKVMEL